MTHIYDTLGVETVINAAGTNTRLSGGMMHPEVTAAMAEAAAACSVGISTQAVAASAIAAVTSRCIIPPDRRVLVPAALITVSTPSVA